MNIPKIIHYCWFGNNPLPESAMKCINSWKKYFPDYEIKEWNETNYNVNIIPFTTEAYNNNKYAFVSDFARFDILYKEGGIYFDTDVEIIKSFNNILNNSFLGMETTGRINPGLGCGFYACHKIISEIIDYYYNLNFNDFIKNNNTIVDITTDILTNNGFIKNNSIQNVSDITIYPCDYFNPIDYDTHYLHITQNTHSIHYGDASWIDKKRKFTAKIHIWLCRILGKKTGIYFSSIVRKSAKSIYKLLNQND